MKIIPCESGWMDNWFSPKSNYVITSSWSSIVWMHSWNNLKFSLKIEKESLLKQLFIKVQLSTFMISANFKILQFLNKGLKGAKFIIFSVFFGE